MAVTINFLILLVAAVAAAQSSCPKRGMFWFSETTLLLL